MIYFRLTIRVECVLAYAGITGSANADMLLYEQEGGCVCMCVNCRSLQQQRRRPPLAAWSSHSSSSGSGSSSLLLNSHKSAIRTQAQPNSLESTLVRNMAMHCALCAPEKRVCLEFARSIWPLLSGASAFVRERRFCRSLSQSAASRFEGALNLAHTYTFSKPKATHMRALAFAQSDSYCKHTYIYDSRRPT